MKPVYFLFSFKDFIWIGIMTLMLVFLVLFPFTNFNNRAIFLMIQKKYALAEQKWLSLLNAGARSSFYRLNLGLNYLLWSQFDKAIEEYEKVRKTPSTDAKLSQDDLFFYSFFNSAVALTQKKRRSEQLPLILNFYQQALSVYPQSKESKINIELLTRDLFSNKSGDEKKTDEENTDQQQEEQGQQQEKEQTGDGGEKKEPEEQNEGQEHKTEEQTGDGGEKKEEPEEQNGDQEQNEESGEKQEGAKDSGGQDGEGEQKQEMEVGEGTPRENLKDSNIEEKQISAILKSLLEKEKEIVKRRQKAGQGRQPQIKKDW